MESFHWDRHFETGHAEIDAQHRSLVVLLNRFGDLVDGQGHAAQAEVDHLFLALADYARYHFKSEEDLMATAGLDRAYQAVHRHEHESFLAEVVQMRSATDDSSAGKALMDFLVHWLAYHILGSDQSLARQVAAVAEGLSPHEAAAREKERCADATTPLLRAVEGLFHLVWSRNHALVDLNRTLAARVEERTRALTEANRELLALVRRVEAEREESRRLGAQLAEANAHLEELATTDVLTGLPNRRHALHRLEQLWAESLSAGTPLACIMVDADGFKPVNDTFGHEAGDRVLRVLARELRHAVRTDDVVCRLGGDEFLIICPGTDLEGGRLAAEQTRAAVAALRVPVRTGAWMGSVSIGVAQRTPQMGSVADLLRDADAAVYAAKRAGRNCVALPPGHGTLVLSDPAAAGTACAAAS